MRGSGACSEVGYKGYVSYEACTPTYLPNGNSSQLRPSMTACNLLVTLCFSCLSSM